MPRPAGVGHPTVEATPSIDVMRWHRRGHLDRPVSVTWAWHRGGEAVGSMRVATGRNNVTLTYRVTNFDGSWEDVKQGVRIAWMPCRFGGERPWFRCSWGRHVARMYVAGRLFACRQCYGLAYACQQAVPRDRNLIQARKIRERLGGDPNVLNPLPSKPSGMHWQTYDRLRRRHDRARDASMAGLAASLQRFRWSDCTR
jgi:hypothetical protein